VLKKKKGLISTQKGFYLLNMFFFFFNKQCHLLHYREAISKGVHNQKANTKNKASDTTTKPEGEIRARR
jgi:hypothetical protein